MNHGGVPGGVMPMIKHRAVDKSGVPVYQPANAAGAYQPLMQFSQQQFVPVTREYYICDSFWDGGGSDLLGVGAEGGWAFFKSRPTVNSIKCVLKRKKQYD